MTRLSVVVLALSMFFSADSFATTWFVKPDGTGDAPTIQAGIDSAVAGDTVSLTNGTYRGDGNRDIDFLGKAIVVRSDFGSSCVIDCEGFISSNHRGFRFHSGEDSTSVLEGITITNGFLSESGRGAGILCENSSGPTLISCVLRNNYVAEWGQGAGLYCEDVTMTLKDCEFLSNAGAVIPYGLRGGLGGGILADACTLSLVNCVFKDNGSSDGGGIYCRDTFLTAVNCRLLSNYANMTFWGNECRGGGIFGESSTLVLDGCVISGNRSDIYGGGICARYSSIVATNCEFTDNVCEDGLYEGGGVCGGGTFTDCVFSGNRAGQGGGGVWGGGTFTRCKFLYNKVLGLGGADAIGAGFGGCGTFVDCEFVGNSIAGAGTGAGLGCTGPSTLINCTFIGNKAGRYDSDRYSGTAVAAYLDSGHILNCTFVDNEFLGRNRGWVVVGRDLILENSIIAFNSGEQTPVNCTPGGTVTLRCSDIYGNEAGDWVGCIAGQDTVNGNFSANPMFCDLENGDFTLASVSKCLPPNNECDVLVGAYGQGCDYAVGVPEDRGVTPPQPVITAYPNPFNPSTNIKYYIRSSDKVIIRLFDVGGRLVTTLVNRRAVEGFHMVTWDGTDLHGQPASSGVYFVRLESSGQVQTRKIVLLK